MEIFAYADETIFDIDSNNGNYAVGYGIFISQRPITTEVVYEAMDNLKNDPEINNTSDLSTIANGYFHASEDSKNAHSHFCNSIRKHVKGIFDFSYHILSTNIPEEKNQQQRFFNNCLNGSSIEFFDSMKTVNLTIEGRNELSKESLEQWRRKIYEIFEGASYELPSFKTYFPKINIEIKGKSNPGLQVTDFISWAASRTLKLPSNPKWDTWFKRLPFVTISRDTSESQKQKRIKGYLNEIPAPWDDYPQNFVKSKTNEDVLNAYIVIERIIRSITESDFTEGNIHLYNDFMAAKRLCTELIHFQQEHLETIGRAFIRLFDSLPIYKNIQNSDSESWLNLFHAKEIATLIIRDDYIHMGRTKDYILRWRYNAINTNKDLFLALVEAVEDY